MVFHPIIKLKKTDLLRCPICGRKPRVKYSILPTQSSCKVECKPLFCKAHLSVGCGQAGEICDRAEQNAFALWNKKVRDKIRHREEAQEAEASELYGEE